MLPIYLEQLAIPLATADTPPSKHWHLEPQTLDIQTSQANFAGFYLQLNYPKLEIIPAKVYCNSQIRTAAYEKHNTNLCSYVEENR